MSDEHMNDKELDAVLREWTPQMPAGQPDRSRVVGTVVSRLGSTRRHRHRRWTLWWFRRDGTNRTSEQSLAQQASPIPAFHGNTPTVMGRTTQSMLSPAKAITVAALVFALGGVLLIAQPFDQRGSSVPGAASDDPAMAPSFFSGAIGDEWTTNAEPVTERRDDGVVDGTGESYTFPWEANDPRISGTATIVTNETDYREGATTLVPTGDVGTVRSGLLRIVNDEGSWEGEFLNLQLENVEFASASGWLTGADAYDGLSAFVLWSFPGDGTFHGHITAEGPPPAPESVPE